MSRPRSPGLPNAGGKSWCPHCFREGSVFIYWEGEEKPYRKDPKNNFRNKVKVTAGPTLFKYGTPQWLVESEHLQANLNGAVFLWRLRFDDGSCVLVSWFAQVQKKLHTCFEFMLLMNNDMSKQQKVLLKYLGTFQKNCHWRDPWTSVNCIMKSQVSWTKGRP